MATKAWRRASLRWPPTPEQWQALQQDLDYVYRWLRDLQANGGGGSGGSADLTHLDADNLTEGTVPAERMPALTGDVTTSVGTVATTLAASGVTAGTYGDATHIPSVTVDAKGRVTAASQSTISNSTITASVYRATNQTLTHNTATAISLSTEHYDAGGLWAIGNPTKFIIPTGGDGVYTFKGQIALGTGFQGVALLQLAKNGTVVKSNTYVGADLASGTEYHEVMADIDLVATDYVELKVTLVLAAGSGTFDVVGGTANTFMQTALCAPMTGEFGSFVKADGTTPLTADWAVGSHKLTGLTDPASAQDAATKAYVDAHGGGSLVLLESHVASASASLDFTSWYSSDYDEYVIEFVNVVPATNNVALELVMSTDGGSSYDTSAIYKWSAWYLGSANDDGIQSNGAGAYIQAGVNIDNDTARGGVCGSARLFNPGSAVHYKRVTMDMSYSASGNSYRIVSHGLYQSATAVDAFQFLFSSGNIASGTIRIYGVAKS